MSITVITEPGLVQPCVGSTDQLMVTPLDKQVSRWSSQTPRWELSASRCGPSATRQRSHRGVNRHVEEQPVEGWEQGDIRPDTRKCVSLLCRRRDLKSPARYLPH